jgi:hypothetical protein
MSCDSGPGASHWAGCKCWEARIREEAYAQGRREGLEDAAALASIFVNGEEIAKTIRALVLTLTPEEKKAVEKRFDAFRAATHALRTDKP